MSTTGGAGVAEDLISYSEARGKWVLFAAILGSGIAGLDATVVNVALPTIGRDLSAGFSALQWTVNGYTLSLAALILLGGSLGDRFGRRKVFLVGVVWFAAASLLCGLAVNVEMLIASRILQGVGGALLTPGSLAIMQASFRPQDRAKAIGAWSGFGGIATAIGPFLGGYLIDAISWRWVFLINLPFAALVILVALRHVPESADPTMAERKVDVWGAVTGAVGLAGLTYGLIAAGKDSFTSAGALVPIGVGVLGLVAFVLVERRSSHPMLPVDIFTSPQFTWANVVTFVVYAALGGLFFLLVVQLQTSLGYSALLSGAASLPITGLMLVLSARAGALAQRIGPRLLMSAGPLTAAVGMFWLAQIGPGDRYLTAVLPGVLLFGLGLSGTVAPLTSTVLAAADNRHSGVASGVNNAVARAAGLLAVAVLPIAAGITGDDYTNAQAFTSGYRTAITIAAVLLAAGGVLAALTIRNSVLTDDDAPCAEPGPELAAPQAHQPQGPVPAQRRGRLHRRHHCAIDGPPQESGR